MGKEKGTDNKNNKILTLRPCPGQGEGDKQQRLVIFVVFGIVGAQVGKEKGTDNKNNNSLRLKG